MRIIAGKYGGRRLRTTLGDGYRPATARLRGALFSMLEARGIIWPGLNVLDLFAGSGSLGFEALSRGAAKVLFVETNNKATELILKSGRDFELEAGRVRVAASQVERLLARPSLEQFGLLFIDPPYAENTVPSCLKLLLKNNWLARGAFIAAEVEVKPQVGKSLDPTSINVNYRLLADRTYGQTRLLLWEYVSEE